MWLDLTWLYLSGPFANEAFWFYLCFPPFFGTGILLVKQMASGDKPTYNYYLTLHFSCEEHYSFVYLYSLSFQACNLALLVHFHSCHLQQEAVFSKKALKTHSMLPVQHQTSQLAICWCAHCSISQLKKLLTLHILYETVRQDDRITNRSVSVG